MVKGGWKRKNVQDGDFNEEEEDLEVDYSFIYSNQQIQDIVGTQPVRNYIDAQYLKYIGHVCRAENNAYTKKMVFAKATRRNYRDPWIKISNLLGVTIEQDKRVTQSRKKFAELIRKRINSSPW